MPAHSKLNLIFMGTPDFAVPALERLYHSRHQVQAVVTVPDKQQGRGRQLRPSAVKVMADKLGLPVLQPERLTDPAFQNELEHLNPDLIVVVAFRILPESVFALPRLGTFNLHASLLPKYRGAAPIHWALMNGERETGVTSFFLKRSVDTGNIIMQKRLPIKDEDNLGSLYAALREMGADVVLQTVDLLSAGRVSTLVQNDGLASPAPKVNQEHQIVDFQEGAEACHNRIRAFAPRPGSYCLRHGERLKLLRSQIIFVPGESGKIIEVESESFTVGCGRDSLRILDVQPESKKAMNAGAYSRGYPLKVGDQLG